MHTLYCEKVMCEHYHFCKYIQNWGKIGICVNTHGGWTSNWNNNKYKIYQYCNKYNLFPSNSKNISLYVELKDQLGI